MKYVLVAIAVFLAVTAAMLAKEGLLKKDNFLQLIGRLPQPEPEAAEPVAVPSLGGSIAEKLAAREKQLEEQAQRLEEEANQLALERSEFEKLRAEVEQKLKALQGELDAQDAKEAQRYKDFAKQLAAMKEDKAATFLATQVNRDEAVKILGQMTDQRKRTKILDKMDELGKTDQAIGDAASDILMRMLTGS